MTDPQAFSITIPSDPSRGLEVQERILKLLAEYEFSQRDIFSMRIGLEEAIVNAVKHGNGCDPDKSVQITCEISNELVRVIVEDEGEGFDPNDVPDPTDFENLEKSSGRGLMMMRHYLSRVEYNSRGNRVLLEKSRSTDDSAAH